MCTSDWRIFTISSGFCRLRLPLVGALKPFALDCTEVQEAASGLSSQLLVVQCHPVHRRAATYLQRFHRLQRYRPAVHCRSVS